MYIQKKRGVHCNLSLSRTMNLASEVPFSFKEFGISFHNLPANACMHAYILHGYMHLIICILYAYMHLITDKTLIYPIFTIQHQEKNYPTFSCQKCGLYPTRAFLFGTNPLYQCLP